MSNAGSSTIKGPFIANGGATFSNDNFKIEVNTGNTDINGKVYIDKTLTVQEDTFIEGDFSCSSGQFRIKNDSGNTSIDINGTLNINSAATFYDIFRLVDSNNITIVNFNTAADSKSYVLGGNFGVGITVPEYKLDVNGDLNLGEGYMYKINGVDVVFSQWETLYGKHASRYK